jgi:hypothetical protein
MAQILINRSEFAKNPVEVIAYYDEGVEIDTKIHGDDVVVLHLPESAVRFVDTHMILVPDWRDRYKDAVVADEAQRRIEDAFPEDEQSNTALELTTYMLDYGTDVARWPPAAKARKAEADRCLNYVKSVRSRRAEMLKGNLPANPNADSFWPTRIKRHQP